ncbi:hypothetical protein AB5J72_36435 [Streptomyces sp. CG1]
MAVRMTIDTAAVAPFYALPAGAAPPDLDEPGELCSMNAHRPND